MTQPKRERWPGECRTAEAVLDVAEFHDSDGRLRFRLSRYFSADGSCWVCHGPFVMYHPAGGVACRGDYRDGQEAGVWEFYYENGQPAARGCYANGLEIGYWQYWQRDGTPQLDIEYEDGVRVTPLQPGERTTQ